MYCSRSDRNFCEQKSSYWRAKSENWGHGKAQKVGEFCWWWG